MVTLQNIKKSFGKNQVLKGVDLHLNTSGVYSILGPNGSGKTTLIKILLGMVNIREGEVQFEGKPVKGENDYRRKIAYLPQIARFPENLKVNELFAFVENLRGNPDRKEELIKLFEIEPYLNKALRNLSGGTRQKINLISCLMYDCPLLILDEPSVGLDPISLLKLKDFIVEEGKRGKLVLITTHIMKLVDDVSDHIVFILDGHIHFNGPKSKLLEESKTQDMEHAMAAILKSNQNDG